MPNADPHVVTAESEVQAALRGQGLTVEVLHMALEAGAAGAALCSPHHPPIFRGLTRWGEIVRSLRDQLCPTGWHADDADNFSTVVRDDRAVAIAVASGNVDTGRAKGHPTTQHAKGPSMHQCIETNLYLPFEHLPPNLDIRPGIWLLLHHQAGHEQRAELSFPVSIAKSGFVTAWGTRLILPPLDLNPARLTLNEDPVAPDVAINSVAGGSQ